MGPLRETGSVDALADVLATTRIGHTVLCRSELAAPWGLRFDPEPRVNFHIVGRGTCWLHVAGLEPLQLVPGDIVLVPQEGGHTIADDLGTPVLPFRDVVGPGGARCSLDHDGGGKRRTVLLCGVYDFEKQERHPLLSVLPALIHVPASEGSSPLASLLQILMREFCEREPGSATVIARLVDALFVLVVRAWLTEQPEGAAGWLGALRDPQIAQALSVIHSDPGRPWTIAALAREVGQSRSAFAQRFSSLVGEPPLSYLTRRRLDLASRLLRDSSEPVYAIAGQVGYDSETSFSRAFRREFGTAPGRYRTRHSTD